MKTILVVENDPMTLQILVGVLKSQCGFLRVLSATNVPAALETFSGEEVHALITGMHMSEMDVFELVSLLGAKYSKTRMIVISNNASAMFRDKIRQMPTVTLFDQALDMSFLGKRIFSELQIDYGGYVKGISLASFLQMLEIEGQSCMLRITAKGKAGNIAVDRGKPIAAKMGMLTGVAAVKQILTWQNVWIDIDYSPKAFPEEFNVSLMNLLLESNRMVDEKVHQRPNFRKHDRFDCLVGMDYAISDWTYQCYLRDISEGGAYIETEQPIKVAQKLYISLTSPALEQTCTIGGTVVRRDPSGIGIRFDKLTLDQKQVIRSLLETYCRSTSPK